MSTQICKRQKTNRAIDIDQAIGSAVGKKPGPVAQIANANGRLNPMVSDVIVRLAFAYDDG